LRTLSLFLRRWNVLPHLSAIYKGLVRHTGAGIRLGLIGLAVVIGLSVILWLFGYRVPALLLPLLCLSGLLLLRFEPAPGRTFAGLLLFTGLLLLLGVEVFFLRDFLGGSGYYRMNTLFKFYIQVWVIMGLAAAYLVVDLWEKAGWAHRPLLGVLWQTALVLLVVASLAYPALGTPSRLRDRFPTYPPSIGTLDGMDYMTTGVLVWPEGNPINLEHDYEAIRWLQDNVQGTPVLAEAKIGFYREGGMRVAAYTGLPMPLGGLHQSEQRWPEQIGPRDGLYMEFWNTPNPERAWQLIDELDISYIYLGQLEQTLYDPEMTDSLRTWGVTYFSPAGRAKFETLEREGKLERVFQNEGTRIYRVRGE
jgi:uncharacterized membrane protein